MMAWRLRMELLALVLLMLDIWRRLDRCVCGGFIIATTTACHCLMLVLVLPILFSVLRNDFLFSVVEEAAAEDGEGGDAGDAGVVCGVTETGACCSPLFLDEWWPAVQ
ncbi:hypothetical protein SAMD00019534_076340 [Acytostelium subglobosum LB1]|uniref:hypothetical protein n=1 Tax=Acytostelium subglobosum LB1 TaxID=1410327 RepID=UPI000644E674|nr:hypothetical protein SAMD00019534_076340 [Acytostelium subglobosum LB1]GAM24459.1 hypothetical protein SAMD00019534_076340 [Acytostelium subglobosum LB1]|eukprot:XP_012752785.1 hypothetical protein SAMD00019534_076340 [Acytostelium subglobosum LB1]